MVKYKVRVYNNIEKSKDEFEEIIFNSKKECCEYLEIKETTFTNIKRGKLKCNTPKTAYLKNIEITNIMETPPRKTFEQNKLQKLLDKIKNDKKNNIKENI